MNRHDFEHHWMNGSHSKTITVDGAVAWIGGHNLTDNAASFRSNAQAFFDSTIRIIGEFAVAMRESAAMIEYDGMPGQASILMMPVVCMPHRIDAAPNEPVMDVVPLDKRITWAAQALAVGDDRELAPHPPESLDPGAYLHLRGAATVVLRVRGAPTHSA